MTILEQILEDYEALFTIEDFTQIWPRDWLEIMICYPQAVSDFEDKIPWMTFDEEEIYWLENYKVYAFSQWEKRLPVRKEYNETYVYYGA